MANTIMLIGRLGSDPKCTILDGGKERAQFNLACARKVDKTKVDWFPCVCFGSIVPNLIKPYVKKGTQVFIKGAFQFNDYEDKDGVTQRSYSVVVDEIELLGTSGDKVENETKEEPIKEKDPQVVDDPDEDLPF